jgi:hypothetical protein
MSFKQLRSWAKWVGGVPATFERATTAVASGRRLLRSENLAPLEALISDAKDRTTFRAYLRTLSSGATVPA